MLHRLFIVAVLLAAAVFTHPNLSASGSAPVSVAGHMKNYHWINARYWPGINAGDTISDQTGINSLMASPYNVIYFPKGVYRVPSSITNSHSNRTFIFADSAVIDGVFHVAAGNGSNDIVRNVTVIGRPIVTERLGTYFCQNVSIEGVTIADTSSNYRTQVSHGTRGVHIYQGSRDITIGDIHIWANDSSIDALGIDRGDTSGAAYEPTNVHIGSVNIDVNNDSSGIRMAFTNTVTIDRAYIRSYNGLNGIHLYASKRAHIGELYISGARTTTSGLAALWIEADSGSSFDRVFIDVDTVTNKGILLSGCLGGTKFGDVTVRSADTVGAKYGFDIETSRDIFVNSLKVTRFAQGVRLVNGKNIRINFMELDSNRIGFATGGTNDTFIFLNAQYSGNTADNSGTAPENITNAVGPLVSPNNAIAGVTVKGTGQSGSLAADSVQPQDGLSSGFLKLVSNSAVAARGSGVYFGNTAGSVDRYYAAIHPYLYTSADSTQGGMSFLIRMTQTDSTLKRAMVIRHDGQVLIGHDTATEYRLPSTRGTGGQILKLGTGGNVVWGNDSVGAGGSGDNMQVDTTLASGGLWDVGNPVLSGDSGIGINRIGSTDSARIYLKSTGLAKQHIDTTNYGYVFDTVSAKSMLFTPTVMARTSGDTTRIFANGSGGNIKLQTGSTGKIHFWDENAPQWLISGDSLIAQADSGVIDGLRSIITPKIDASAIGTGELVAISDVVHIKTGTTGDTILSISENGDTTKFSSHDNAVLQFGESGLTEADSLAAKKLIVDTAGGHLFYFPRSKPTAGALLSFVDVAGAVDSAGWVTPPTGVDDFLKVDTVGNGTGVTVERDSLVLQKGAAINVDVDGDTVTFHVDYATSFFDTSASGQLQIKSSGVTSTQVAANTLDSTDLANNSVSTNEIAASTIDSTDIKDLGIAIGDINWQREEIPLNLLLTPAVASAAESSWTITEYLRRGNGSGPNDTMFLFACSSSVGSGDTLRFEVVGQVPYSFLADSVRFIYWMKSTQLVLDSIRLYGDTLSSATLGREPHVVYQDSTTRSATTLSEAKLAVTAASGSSLFRGRWLRIWFRLRVAAATSANSVLLFHSASVIGRRR